MLGTRDRVSKKMFESTRELGNGQRTTIKSAVTKERGRQKGSGDSDRIIRDFPDKRKFNMATKNE